MGDRGWPTEQQTERAFLTHPCQQGVRKSRLLFLLVTEKARMSAKKGWGDWNDNELSIIDGLPQGRRAPALPCGRTRRLLEEGTSTGVGVLYTKRSP